MIICPLKNSPRISQVYGHTEFSQGGAYGYVNNSPRPHNGVDYAVKVGTPIYAPFDGILTVKDSGNGGYGLHVKIRSREKNIECVIAHLSDVNIKNDTHVRMGDKIAESGNTGFSTGAHVHFGVRRLVHSQESIKNWLVRDYNNVDYGYEDPTEFMINW